MSSSKAELRDVCDAEDGWAESIYSQDDVDGMREELTTELTYNFMDDMAELRAEHKAELESKDRTIAGLKAELEFRYKLIAEYAKEHKAELESRDKTIAELKVECAELRAVLAARRDKKDAENAELLDAKRRAAAVM